MKRRHATTLMGLAIMVTSILGHASSTDCEGMEVDGQAQCIDPQWISLQYSACDERAAYVYIQNAWTACGTELNVPSIVRDEGTALALANCVDRKLGGPSGGQMAAINWDSPGTTYQSNFCFSGTSVDFAGHHILRLGHAAGAFANFTFSQSDPPTCPTGYTSVNKMVAGVSRLVACKPNPTCSPGTEMNAAKNACVVVINGEQCKTCPELGFSR